MLSIKLGDKFIMRQDKSKILNYNKFELIERSKAFSTRST